MSDTESKPFYRHQEDPCAVTFKQGMVYLSWTIVLIFLFVVGIMFVHHELYGCEGHTKYVICLPAENTGESACYQVSKMSCYFCKQFKLACEGCTST